MPYADSIVLRPCSVSSIDSAREVRCGELLVVDRGGNVEDTLVSPFVGFGELTMLSPTGRALTLGSSVVTVDHLDSSLPATRTFIQNTIEEELGYPVFQGGGFNGGVKSKYHLYSYFPLFPACTGSSNPECNDDVHWQALIRVDTLGTAKYVILNRDDTTNTTPYRRYFGAAPYLYDDGSLLYAAISPEDSMLHVARLDPDFTLEWEAHTKLPHSQAVAQVAPGDTDSTFHLVLERGRLDSTSPTGVRIYAELYSFSYSGEVSSVAPLPVAATGRRLRVYPNPAPSGAPLRLELPPEGVTREAIPEWARVYTSEGRPVGTYVIDPDGTIATSELAPGAYYLEVGSHRGLVGGARVIVR